MLRPRATTLAPSAARSSTIARPRPPEAPVTSPDLLAQLLIPSSLRGRGGVRWAGSGGRLNDSQRCLRLGGADGDDVTAGQAGVIGGVGDDDGTTDSVEFAASSGFGHYQYLSRH